MIPGLTPQSSPLIDIGCLQGGRQDFHFGGALFNDDVTMTSLLADIEPKILGGL